jgi:hypothetical protein
MISPPGMLENARTVLGSLAPHLSPEQIAEAIAATKAISDAWDRVQILYLLAPRVPSTEYHVLLESFIEVTAELPRYQALGVVASSPHISAALGGAETLTNVYRAVSDTACWYP